MELFVVTGGAASGKSAFAEKLASAASGGRTAYCATMRICDDESRLRVERHRQMRASKGFETIECPAGIPDIEKMRAYDTVLIECLSNLTANLLFTCGRTPEQAVSQIRTDMGRLHRMVKHLVVVTNDVFADGGRYDPGTVAFMRTLGRINMLLAEKADAVVETVCGIPVIQKGEEMVKENAAFF